MAHTGDIALSVSSRLTETVSEHKVERQGMCAHKDRLACTCMKEERLRKMPYVHIWPP